MKTEKIILTLFLAFLITNSFGQTNDNWLQWRGPLGSGAALKGNPPTEFNESKNLKWKTAIPGKGHATPIVWEDKIIIQTAMPTNEKIEAEEKEVSEGQRRMSGSTTDAVYEFKVVLVNRESGLIEWETTVTKEHPEESTHNLGSWASNSPCTDGEFIYAYFGSRGIYCLDFSGEIQWQKDYGQMQKVMSFGEGASPYLYKDKLFIQWDHEGESFIVALNKKTGEEEWKVARDEGTSWATPFVVEVNGKTQVITSATTQVRSYDYDTGEIIWTSTGLTRNVIPNPVYANGILYVMSGFRGNALQAIDLPKAKWDITGSDAILWTYNQDTPYTPCPLLMDGKLYFLRANNGELTCLDAKTGKVFYSKEKLERIGNLYSSPSGVGDRIYDTAENICLVIKAGEKFEIIASNELNDNFHASPVIVGNELILRGFNSLYCFTEK
ncbi:MAG TPA: PQQ-binding-like beta-propeller repeat protein [Draconibacterium sp.]|nr:PQQ-binding-like beta-propeller repeat protein [Draconibacterium sp.]